MLLYNTNSKFQKYNTNNSEDVTQNVIFTSTHLLVNISKILWNNNS